jgi:RNA polymerase sigma-70 factor (ECF subfamily)
VNPVPDVPGLIDHLFRHQAGRMVSTLTRILGPKNLVLAEDVVQEALVRALELWPFQGVPDNPSAWLIQVAKNRAVDWLRREESLAEKTADIAHAFAPIATGLPFEDDEVCMLFLCAHPALRPETRLALTLKTVGGFGVREIARALLAEEAAVAQRLVRAKRQIRDEDLTFELPRESELAARLDSVLAVLYLMFNEGYGALRGDLCEEATRMARMVARDRATARPATHALLALLLLHSSRFAARLDPSGALLLLGDQDRSLWDRGRIHEGLFQLDRAAAGDAITPYHLEAGIAAEHAVAKDAASTDWAHIAELYDHLYELKPTPVVGLNRAVAVARVRGARAGIEEIEKIAGDPSLRNYYLLPAALGALWREVGEAQRAGACFAQALGCPCAEAERKFLEQEKRALSYG